MKQRIGPSKGMFFVKTFAGKGSLIAYVLVVLAFINITAMLPDNFIASYTKLPYIGKIKPEGLLIISGILLLILLFIKNLVVYKATAYYVIEDSKCITLKYLVGTSFATDTIMLSQVYDCDSEASLLQALFKSGNLIITTVDRQIHVVRWVVSVENVREHISAESGGRDMRPIGMV